MLVDLDLPCEWLGDFLVNTQIVDAVEWLASSMDNSFVSHLQ